MLNYSEKYQHEDEIKWRSNILLYEVCQHLVVLNDIDHNIHLQTQ